MYGPVRKYSMFYSIRMWFLVSSVQVIIASTSYAIVMYNVSDWCD